MDSPTALALAIETTAHGTGQVLRTRAAVQTYILRLGPFMLREKLMRERALSTDQPIVLFISAPTLFFFFQCTWNARRMRKTRS